MILPTLNKVLIVLLLIAISIIGIQWYINKPIPQSLAIDKHEAIIAVLNKEIQVANSRIKQDSLQNIQDSIRSIKDQVNTNSNYISYEKPIHDVFRLDADSAISRSAAWLNK